MRSLILLLISFFLIGCGPDMDDPEEIDALLEEAIDISEIQKRGEGDQELIYAQNKQQPYTGWVKILRSNGQVEELWEVEDGKWDGLYFSWAKSGAKKSEKEFKDGKEHGDATVWHENGQMAAEMEYKDGKRHGDFTAWYENGQKSAEGESKDGENHGDLTAWYENGQKKLEGKFENGKPFEARVWLPNGTKCLHTNLQDGNGIVVNYDDDGKESSRTEFKDGTIVSE
ncbi:toxin-antitoxin system YwqK family antitoxin [Akkermansiaceae bacterium]|nr:toxin-antitoxin system YwqK family antitoxin [Akkermansiaceae bacterium]